MEEHNQEAFHRQHAETVSGVMGYFAKEFDPEKEEFWRCVGMLHDLDYEEFPEEHCIREQQWLEELDYDPAMIRAICAHGLYGMAVPTALTIQNTLGVTGVHVPPPSKSSQLSSAPSCPTSRRTP